MDRFKGRVAVVTGGNSGIGLATAQRLHHEGARVAISGRDPKTLESAVTTIGPGTVAVQADVSKLADIDKLYDEVQRRLGKIDVLFANAGIAKFVSYAGSDEALFDEMFDINVKGLFFTIQKAIPLLNDGAAIVLNTSTASTKGTADMSIYAATKAAVRSFARTAAAELAPRNIRVNAVAPGPVETPIFARTGLSAEQARGMKDFLSGRVPLKRIGRPEEIAAAVAFLASPDASFITGVELNVDGGVASL
jgi:NAD(P)-dependent dehydrogenase (short-subunit alcohol dehydrogenase family)